MRSLLPGVAPDGRRLLQAKALRGVGDGLGSVTLAAYLTERGFSALQVGVLAAAALFGTGVATLLVGLWVERLGRRRVLIAASLAAVATGLAFASAQPYWLLLAIAFVGTVNPSAGDVSVFLPVEQAALVNAVRPERRTWLYARYSLVGSLAAAVGALASALPGLAARAFGWELELTLRLVFVAYAGLAGLMLLTYRGLTPAVELATRAQPRGALRESRGVVLRLSALFSVDSFGGGLVVQSVLALWLFERYGLSVEAAGAIFFVTGLLSAGSLLLAAPLADRIGLIPTMAYTHLPANIALMLVPLAPTLWLALPLLFLRHALSQLDVPPRTAYVVSVVTPEERAAAAGVTNVVRSLSSAAGPALGGAMLSAGPFGLPLMVAGGLKAAYDVALLRAFRRVPVRAEAGAGDGEGDTL